jgi:molecular chaperone GrpE
VVRAKDREPMSQGDEHGKRGRGDSDLSDQIDRTMAEAEAAISALEEKERAEEAAAAGRDSEDVVALDDDDGDDEYDALEAEAQSLRAEVAATKDKWLRAVADMENYKKRIKREMEEQAVRTAQTLLPSFLPVMDNLERALECAPAAIDGAGENVADVENLIKGIELVRKEFLAALARHDIEPIAAIGLPFDPAVHDALQQLDSPDHPPGVVIREFEKGYKMRDRLLRPARVIVAGPGSTG